MKKILLLVVVTMLAITLSSCVSSGEKMFLQEEIYDESTDVTTLVLYGLRLDDTYEVKFSGTEYEIEDGYVCVSVDMFKNNESEHWSATLLKLDECN